MSFYRLERILLVFTINRSKNSPSPGLKERVPCPLCPFFLINPVARSLVITDRFNAPREYAFAPDKKQLHEGVDLMAIDPQGQPVAVLAAQRGVVNRVAFTGQGYGHYVRIVHAWGGQTYVTWYGHLSTISVR